MNDDKRRAAIARLSNAHQGANAMLTIKAAGEVIQNLIDDKNYQIMLADLICTGEPNDDERFAALQRVRGGLSVSKHMLRLIARIIDRDIMLAKGAEYREDDGEPDSAFTDAILSYLREQRKSNPSVDAS